MKKHNFSAGPCILPQEVLKEAAQGVLNFNNDNLSLIEISHRSQPFIDIINKAQSLVKELLEVPAGYSVLFLQGGASLEFLMVPLNLMKVKGKAAYNSTGTWANKAINEAKKIGEVRVVSDSSDKNYNYIPNYKIPDDCDYFHCTSNNTIYGTQMKEFPSVPTLMVCDMSSDIFSRRININNFDIIYAGAQKNMGPAGTTLVIIRDEILGKTGREIPTMLDYKTHISKNSMFNTPPVFPIYVSMLTLKWLKDLGGIEKIEEINQRKADLLYAEIDSNPLFKGIANKEACFLLTDSKKEEVFNNLCQEAGINGLKGHRSVGGYRASMYNAMPIESIQVLVEIMRKLKQN